LFIDHTHRSRGAPVHNCHKSNATAVTTSSSFIKISITFRA